MPRKSKDVSYPLLSRLTGLADLRYRSVAVRDSSDRCSPDTTGWKIEVTSEAELQPFGWVRAFGVHETMLRIIILQVASRPK